MLRVAAAVATVLVLTSGVVTGQSQDTAVGSSCASWLQRASDAKPVTREVSLEAEEVQKLAREARAAGFAMGFRLGYATGVMSATDALPLRQQGSSHIKNVGELVTALDALCSSAPQKRLIDVALHALGYR